MRLVRNLLIASAIMGAGPAAAAGKLNLYIYAAYAPPELMKAFEKEYDVDVTVDTFESNEALLAKMQAGGSSYDLIVTAHNFVDIYFKEGLIQPIGLKEMPNFKNLDIKFVEADWNPEHDYAVPWQWGTTSFAVDTAVYGGEITSFATLFDPPKELSGKIGMFKSAADLITLAEVSLGVPFCTEDSAEMQRVLELLEKQKPAVKLYGAGSAMREQLVSGELAMITNWNGQIKRARAEKESIKYIYPSEGVVGWIDAIAIPKNAPNADNARKFINFVLDPKNMAIVSNHAGYANPVPASKEYLNEDLRDAPEIQTPADVKVFPMKTCTGVAAELEAQLMTELLE